MTPAKNLYLDDDQRFALMKFRHKLSDCTLPTHCDDYYLLKWLKARKFIVDDAEKMLRDSLAYRASIGADRLEFDWNPPEILRRHFPSGVCGVDKDHVPIVVVPFADLDIFGILQATSKQEFLKMSVQVIDRYLGQASDISRHIGRPSFSAPEAFVIIDLQGFVFSRYTSHIAPSVFSMVFPLIRPFIPDITLAKLHIFGSNKRKWQTFLLRYIEPQQLPVNLGGTLTGPDGDPKCSDKISYGGMVATTMYRDNSHGEDITTVSVKKNKKIQLNFSVNVQEKGWHLKWKIYTEKRSILFSLYKSGPGKEMIKVMEPRRIYSTRKSSPVVGSYLCEDSGDYTVQFENRSSLHNKKVHYRIHVSPDFTDDDK